MVFQRDPVVQRLHETGDVFRNRAGPVRRRINTWCDPSWIAPPPWPVDYHTRLAQPHPPRLRPTKRRVKTSSSNPHQDTWNEAPIVNGAAWPHAAITPPLGDTFAATVFLNVPTALVPAGALLRTNSPGLSRLSPSTRSVTTPPRPNAHFHLPHLLFETERQRHPSPLIVFNAWRARIP